MRQALISFPLLGEDFVLNPPAYFLVGNFPIYLYGVVIACGFLLGLLFVAKHRERIGLTMDNIYDFLLFGVPAAIVCARLYYVIFYWELYAGDFGSVFRIRDGGLAIYGGVIGAALALVLRARRNKVPIGAALDMAGLGLPVGQCVGRWGNFFNREAYGYETDIFCRMGLTPPGGETFYVHPTFLYESLWNLAGVILLNFLAKKGRKYPGQFFLFYLAWYGVGRAMIEGLRSDSLWLVPEKIRVSQLLALLSAAAAITLYALNNARIKKGLPPVWSKPSAGQEEQAPCESAGPSPDQDKGKN